MMKSFFLFGSMIKKNRLEFAKAMGFDKFVEAEVNQTILKRCGLL